MKKLGKTTKPRPSKRLVPAATGRGFPGWIVEQIIDEHLFKAYPDSPPKSSHKSMRLSDEIQRTFKNPLWSLVEHVVSTLDPGAFNSHAGLAVAGSSYVQCLCGLKGWHLEWRITRPSRSYVHYRACLPGGSNKAFKLKQRNGVSDGEVRDIVQLYHVLAAFHAFHQGLGMPDSLEWREIDV